MALTTAQASQNALNIAVQLQNNIRNGNYKNVDAEVQDLAAAVILLAEVLNVNAGSLGSSISPTSVAIGGRYSGTQANTSPIYTSPG